jgi:hypothetical protein
MMPRKTAPRPSSKPPDHVSSEFPDGAIKLFTKLLPATRDGEAKRVWIEGDRLSLEYLGKMILTQAAFSGDCHYGLSPKSAGRAFFKRTSTVGIVIHRLPCLSPKRKAVKITKLRKKLQEK